MKKQKSIEQYLIGTFTDFTGEQREFVICAISTRYGDECFNNIIFSSYKTCSFGISVRNHGDVFSEEKGKSLARSHAMSKPFEVISVVNNITINYSTVEAHLKSFADYFQRDPSIFIPSYKIQEEKYKKDPQLYLEKREFQAQKEKNIKELKLTLKNLINSKYSPKQKLLKQ